MAFGRIGSVGAGFGHIGAGTGPSGPAALPGGAGLLVGEANGFATDFTYATDASRVAVKTAGVVTNYALDAFYTNGGTSPKLVYDVAGTLVWSPHNMFLNSAAPVTQSVTTIVGQNYTVTVTGTGSMTGSAGASGVASAGAPLTYTATTTTSTFTKAGSPTTIQMNRGATATAYIATAAAIKNGLAIDYHPTTHAALGLLVEPVATNLLLNNATFSTQSVTVTAVAHTLSIFGTGTVTLTGVSTAGPLVGTGASNRVTLTFTPTAGSLTLTVTGTVSNAQLETGTVATSLIPTFAASATRAFDGYLTTPSAVGYSATAGSWWVIVYLNIGTSNPGVIGNTGAAGIPISVNSASPGFHIQEGGNLIKTVTPHTGVAHKVIATFQVGDRAITANGLTVATDAGVVTNLLAPSSTIAIGANGVGTCINGYLRQVRYLPRRPTGAEMVTMTT